MLGPRVAAQEPSQEDTVWPWTRLSEIVERRATASGLPHAVATCACSQASTKLYAELITAAADGRRPLWAAAAKVAALMRPTGIRCDQFRAQPALLGPLSPQNPSSRA